MKDSRTFLVISIVVVLSFLLFSSMFYPLLNSDNAITILMIHYFKLPNDLYFWGQDRMGSLIPLIAQIPNKILHISPVVSESITHYIILFLGFLSFSYFIKTNYYKIVFAIIWFFPPMRLIDLTQFSFGVHYSLIAIACYLLSISESLKIRRNKIKYHIILILLTLILIGSIWVSDMAMISVALVVGTWLIYHVKGRKLHKSVLTDPLILYTLIGMILGYVFIHYAKGISSKKVDFAEFNSISTTIETVKIFLATLKDFFLFRQNEPFTSIYSYLVLLIIGYTIFLIPKLNLDSHARKIFIIFFLDFLALLSIIMISKWTLLNNVPRRYFTCSYVSLSFSLVLVFDNLKLKKLNSMILKISIGITVVLAGFGTIYNLNYIWPRSITPRIKIAREFQQLGEIGIIAEYWNSYINSCDNPDLIKATPHDKAGSIRNYKIVDEVFKRKKIYVIKDMWLKTFPDTLHEFGHVLIKNGEEFEIGNSKVCQYRKQDVLKDNSRPK